MDHYLQPLFEPRSIAVIGATERASSPASIVFQNLIADTGKRQVYAVNPKHQSVYEHTCYKRLSDIENKIDLAVIVTPADTVADIVEECGKEKIKAAIIISVCYNELGKAELKLVHQLVAMAKRYHIRLVGPDCLGIIRTSSLLNASSSRCEVLPGNLALVSQSSALCASILDWAENRNMGFSTVVSLGATLDVHFGDVLDYLLYDTHSKSILLYIEEIKNARAFMSALRAASRVKPILALKVGRHASASDDIFNAALRQAGVVRGYKVNDLFIGATALAQGKRLKGENLVIITNGGGPAALAADRAWDLNIKLAELPDSWQHANPIDLLGDATPQLYSKHLQACIENDAVHGILVILTPQTSTAVLDVANAVIEVSKTTKKVILCCWMGGKHVNEARELLQTNTIPTFQTPESAIEGFAFLRNFFVNQQLLLQAPPPLEKENTRDTSVAKTIVNNALEEGRDRLTELESLAILNAYGIATTHAALARDANEAILQAETIGYPVALKIYCKEIPFKTGAGGVRLNLTNANAVSIAFGDIIASATAQHPRANIIGVTVESMQTPQYGRELLVGFTTDTIFGPVISFGAGGVADQLLDEREVAIPPLNQTMVKELIGRTRVAKLLGAYQQQPACHTQAIEHVLLRVSEIACELPEIMSLEINPLIVDQQTAIAVDARMVVRRHTSAGKYDHMAIHPYPSELVQKEVLSNGQALIIRPIRPEDAQIEKAFFNGLSAEAKFHRFMYGMKELPQSSLIKLTQIDYDLEMALIAVLPSDEQDIAIGVARYVTNVDRKSCEFAVVIADEWHRKGIAFKLMHALIKSAQRKGLLTIEGIVLSENSAMLAFCKRMGFDIHPDYEDSNLYRVSKKLG